MLNRTDFIRSRSATKRIASVLGVSLVLIAAAAVVYVSLEGKEASTRTAKPVQIASPVHTRAVTDQPVRPSDTDVERSTNSLPVRQADATTLDAFSLLLARREFESAVEAYDHLYTRTSVALSSTYRELMLDHASDLIQRADAALAVSLLRQYVSIYFTDVEALIMLGQAYRESGDKFAAVQSLQQAYQYEHRAGVADLILGQTNTILGEYVQQLKEDDDQQAIVNVYRWLTEAQPGVPGYYIGLAKAYAAQQRYAEAADALRYVKNDYEVGPQARFLLQELAAHHDI